MSNIRVTLKSKEPPTDTILPPGFHREVLSMNIWDEGDLSKKLVQAVRQYYENQGISKDNFMLRQISITIEADVIIKDTKLINHAERNL